MAWSILASTKEWSPYQVRSSSQHLFFESERVICFIITIKIWQWVGWLIVHFQAWSVIHRCLDFRLTFVVYAIYKFSLKPSALSTAQHVCLPPMLQPFLWSCLKTVLRLDWTLQLLVLIPYILPTHLLCLHLPFLSLEKFKAVNYQIKMVQSSPVEGASSFLFSCKIVTDKAREGRDWSCIIWLLCPSVDLSAWPCGAVCLSSSEGHYLWNSDPLEQLLFCQGSRFDPRVLSWLLIC